MKKGFTLIELLVVIAIIGILSGVVLTSLGTARSKGSDAAIKGDLDGIRSESQIYYDGTGNQSYGTTAVSLGTCPTSGTAAANLFVGDSSIKQAISAAASASGGNVLCVSSQLTGTTNATFAVASPLKTSPSTYWCVDSNGDASSTAGVVTGGVCN